MCFCVTRIKDLEVDEDLTEKSCCRRMEREVMRRRFEPAVRLEVEDTMSADVLEKKAGHRTRHRQTGRVSGARAVRPAQARSPSPT